MWHSTFKLHLSFNTTSSMICSRKYCKPYFTCIPFTNALLNILCFIEHLFHSCSIARVPFRSASLNIPLISLNKLRLQRYHLIQKEEHITQLIESMTWFLLICHSILSLMYINCLSLAKRRAYGEMKGYGVIERSMWHITKESGSRK